MAESRFIFDIGQRDYRTKHNRYKRVKNNC